VTITEALAELKLIAKKIGKKQEFIVAHIGRPTNIRDPLEKEGGSEAVVKSETQAVHDLMERVVEIRRGIQTANANTEVTIQGVTRTIADWLIWRREVAPMLQRFQGGAVTAIKNLRSNIDNFNRQHEEKLDAAIHTSETNLQAAQELTQHILDELDGQLSLKNATVTI